MSAKDQLREFFSIWMETDALYSQFAKASGITGTTFWILYCIRQSEENITQTDISQQWSIPKQTLNSSLRELAKKNLITLTELESDRRSKLVALTEEGKLFSEKHVDPICKIEEAAFERMSDSEREAMLGGVKKFLEMLKLEARNE
ncbi:MAG: MarR family transcriptional regulator [Clostridiales bacterium]|jgi:DNA-binding MarR family transcriptional regulator|nr:MarR family transcriptional regulator [Clostridiales bacterium]